MYYVFRVYLIPGKLTLFSHLAEGIIQCMVIQNRKANLVEDGLIVSTFSAFHAAGECQNYGSS